MTLLLPPAYVVRLGGYVFTLSSPQEGGYPIGHPLVLWYWSLVHSRMGTPSPSHNTATDPIVLSRMVVTPVIYPRSLPDRLRLWPGQDGVHGWYTSCSFPQEDCLVHYVVQANIEQRKISPSYLFYCFIHKCISFRRN